MSATKPKNAERSFGLGVGGVALLVATMLWWRGRTGRADITAIIGVLLVLGGLIRPQVLKYPSAAWWKLAAILGYVNARVLLTLLYSVLLVPISVVWRMSGNDPLARRRDGYKGWLPSPDRYKDRRHFERMF